MRRQKTIDDGFNDHETLRKVSVPFASCEEAEAAWKAFFEEVYAARVKHKITDVLLVGSFNAMMDGEEGGLFAMSSMGSVERTASLSAWAFAQCQKTHEERLAKLVRSGGMSQPTGHRQ